MKKLISLVFFLSILNSIYADDEPKRTFRLGFFSETTSEDSEEIRNKLEKQFSGFEKTYHVDINSIANTLAHILKNSNLSLEACKSISTKINERNKKIDELAQKIFKIETSVEELKSLATTYYFPEKGGNGAIVNNNNFYFYLNESLEPIKKDNKLRIFQEARSFNSSGNAVIKEDNRYKVVDRNFNVIKFLDYDLVGEFNYGLALVMKRDSKSGEDRYGFIDENFYLVESRGHIRGLRFENATSFGICGEAIVHLKRRKYLRINSEGKVTYKGRANAMPTVDNDCNSYFKKNNREIMITKDGRKHSNRGVFYPNKEIREGFLLVQKGDWFGFRNEKGDYLDPEQGGMVSREKFPFYHAQHFEEGYAVVGNRNNEYGYIDTSGKFANQGGYEYIEKLIRSQEIMLLLKRKGSITSSIRILNLQQQIVMTTLIYRI